MNDGHDVIFVGSGHNALIAAAYLALASKVNIYPLAILLPGAFALRYFITDRKQ